VADRDDDPVVFVSYDDCLRYCRWRSEKEGLPAGAYNLPTEAQWEAAARGGQTSVYPWGDEITPDVCNTLEAGRGRTLPADQGARNGYGLVHIGGNVREWCRDYYLDGYYGSPEACGPDPAGPAHPGLLNVRVVRGASFQDKASDLGRCAARNYSHAAMSANDIGFRCVRKRT
jgi:formylglycine-generating enzyme required for sulfatase activity